MFQIHYIPIDANCQVNELPDGDYCVPGCKFHLAKGKVEFACLQSNDLDKGIRFIQQNNISSICLNSYHGYELQDTDCLFSLPHVTQLLIHGSWMDKSGVHSLKALQWLGSGDLNSDVDLSHFPDLRFFGGDYCKELVIPPELPQMEKMRLWKYPFKDMMSFPRNPKWRAWN